MSKASAAVPELAFVREGKADVVRIRERSMRRRLLRSIVVVYGVALLLAYLELHGLLRLPPVPPNADIWGPGAILVLVFSFALLVPFVVTGRSPHVIVPPDQIDIGLRQVRGLDGQVEDVLRTLEVFLGYMTFKDQLGGNPRRGVLFEGPPGTGKTYLAKAMAKEAGVPFLFVSATAFQSPFVGMTSSKIRRFFKALRKAARKEGGAIGFIEEIDAIGGARGGLNMSPAPGSAGRQVSSFTTSEGSSGVVNELLVQMQSFDQVGTLDRMKVRLATAINRFLPDNRRLKMGHPVYNNILVIAATNRADSLDPALLRPGRFDRRLYFDLPTKQARRELIDFFLDRKAHDPHLDAPSSRDRMAQETFGYTPVMIEHMFDEAILVALRNGRRDMQLSDVFHAKLTEEIGLPQPIAYTDEERRIIATHEAGHATAAHLLGTTRRLEVLSIVKRRSSLGLLAHSDLEERFTQSRSELEASVAIALAGMAAEEIYFGETSTGPGSDLTGATTVAAAMVGSLGMGSSLLSFEAVSNGMVSQTNLVGRVLGDPDAKREAEAVLVAQKERVLEALGANRDILESLRDALIEHDELVGEEILEVIDDAIQRRKILVMPESPATIRID